MIRYRIYYGIILVLTALLFLWTGTAQMLLLLFLLSVFPLLSVFLTVVWMYSLKLETVMPASCMTGQEVSVHFHITKNPGWTARQLVIPLTVYYRMFGREESAHLSVYPGYSRKQEFLLPVETDLCGEVEIRTSEVFCYDVFRLFRIRKTFADTQKMMICPQLFPISLLLSQRPKSRETGDIYDENVSGNDAAEIFDLRSYQEGDSIRSVHWKLSSKLDRLLVREFSRPSSFDTIVLFSLSGKGAVADRRIAQVAGLSISVIEALLKLDIEHRVGCMVNGRLLEFPVCSRTDIRKVRDSMMGMRAQEGPDHIIQTFMKAGRQFHYTKVIYITAQLFDEPLKMLTAQVSLTVIFPVEGEEDYTDKNGGYELLALSEKNPEQGRYIYI